MAKPSVNDRVTAMARDVLGPKMKEAGFRRSGRVFWREGPEVCHVASIEMSRWGSSDDSCFNVALGVFWHHVEAVLENPSTGKMPPPEFRCTFRIDLGRVLSTPPMPGWRVTSKSNFDAIGAKVWDDLRDHGLAWMEYRSKLKHTLEWNRYATLEADGTYSRQELVVPDALVVFKVMLGKRANAVSDLKRFAKNGHLDDAKKLARRLRLPTRGISR
jgi:Domain of unknown function (DUF4304)